ncbi:MAG TPA: extracellular solute-binding protein [Spirochaetia bacterium]|nr:extracellular solute-binding protein [Spirochaetia bacterium]
MKRLIFKVAAMASLFLFAGAIGSVMANGQKEGAAGGGNVKIRFATQWQAGSTTGDAPIAVPILEKWAKDHPNVQLVQEVSVGDEMRNTIRTDVAANNAPDIWQFWAGGVLNDYAREGILLDMSKYLAVSKVVKKSDIPEFAWKTTTVDGVIRALPRNVALGAFFANRELFQKYGLQYPKTWSEFLADGKIFREHGVIPTNIGSKGGNPSHFWYNDLVCQYTSGNPAIENLQTSLSFQDPAFLKAAQYSDQMRKAGMFPDDVVANGDWAPSIALYDQGNVAMGYTFPWDYAEMPADIVAKTDIIPIPKLPDGQRDPATFIQGTVNDAYCVYAKSFADVAKQPVLTSLLDTIDKDIGFALAQAGNMVSIDQEVMSRVDTSKIPNAMMVKAIQYQNKTHESGSPMIWASLPSNKTQFDYQSGLDELWTGAATPTQFIAKVQKSLDDYKASR